MKQLRYLLFLFLVPLLFACSDSETTLISNVDPLPFPTDENKDLSVSPGDDFFQYCNGTWLKNHPISANTIGGLYDAQNPMNERVEQLKASDPEIGAFFNLMDGMYSNPEASMAYIQQQVDAMAKPASNEEAFKAMGRMLADGLGYPISFYSFFHDGKVQACICPPISNFGLFNLPPDMMVPIAEVSGAASEVVGLVLEGMGIGSENIYIPKGSATYFKQLKAKSVEELYAMMQDAWKEFYPYVSPDGLKEYNTKNGSSFTQQVVQSEARTLIGYPLSYKLAERYIPESKKAAYKDIVVNVRDSFRKRLLKVDWMSETTKNNAVEKLDAMGLYVGYPDEWHTDCMPEIKDCQTFVEAAYRTMAANMKLQMKLLGSDDSFSMHLMIPMQSSDNTMVPEDLTLVNCFYEPSENNIYIYPAFMLPPLWKEGVSEAYHYSLFCVIGHEITHGFDSNGSTFDKIGNQLNWWTVADKMAFEDRKQKLVRCYSLMEMDADRSPGVYGDGSRTLNENIADLGGFLTALDAYQEYLITNGYIGEPFRDQLKKFYEGYANFWCVQYNNSKWNILLNSDVHSAARLRINGVVMNTDLWYDLYNVDRNSILYLPKEERTYIW